MEVNLLKKFKAKYLFFKVFIISFMLAIGVPSHAYETVDHEMSSGETLSITKFEGDGETIIIWIPTERGYRKGSIPVTQGLADAGIDVHAIDLHGSYMLETGNSSFDDFETEDLLELISQYKAQGFKEVYFKSAGRGAVVTLKTVRDWQLKHPNDTTIKGAILTYPHFIEGRPEIGTEANYVPISKMTNLPVYLIQPEYSTKYARSKEIADQLKIGGSSVFIHLLKDVHGGFYMREDDRLTEIDMMAKGNFAGLIENAVQILRTLPPVLTAAPSIEVESKATQNSLRSSQLYPYKGDANPPITKLKTLDGKNFDLASTKGEVVLVNFWASWCGPCIEEIPSLNRLVDRLKDQPFRVVAVNIGETEEVITDFLKQLGETGIQLNFPVLLDEQGKSVRDWKVYAYPSNYLLNKEGKITHAYRGALEWDAPHIVSTIETLF